MEWFGHYDDLLTAEGFLYVRCPSIELVCCVWEQDAIIFGFGLLDDLEELDSDLRCGRDTSVRGTSEDEEHVLACFNHFISLFIAVATTGCHWWENVFIVGLSTAVEDSYDVTVVFLAHSTESILEVVQRDLFARIGYNNLAHVVLHHTVAGIIHNSQCLLVGP